MGLESYQARYTYQLTDWTERVYKKRGIDYVIVPGTTIDDSEAIVTGQVLDAHGRSYFGMSQMMNLVQMMKSGEVTKEDIVKMLEMKGDLNTVEAYDLAYLKSLKHYKPRNL